MNSQSFVWGEKHFAGTDILVPAGNLKQIVILGLIVCDLNIEFVSGPDYLSEFNPTQTSNMRITPFGIGDKIDNHF
jgi:hypothetical protein